MSIERKKVLEMLAAGKITAEDAERLLDRLAGHEGADPSAPGEASGETARPPRLKHLRVVVDGGDDEKVNIRVPLALVRTGIKLSTVLPGGAAQKLADRGIDLSHLADLNGEELIDALRDFTVDVDSGEGETVRIFCE